jgi:quercetin dioxygenase-like cupin family protein
MKLIQEDKITPSTIEGSVGSVRVHDIINESIQAGVRIVMPNSDVPKPMHKHPERQILYVIKGTAEITNGSETLKVKPGDFVVFEENEEHYVRTTGDEVKLFEIKFP